MKTIIIAAGKSLRLRPLTKDIPKCLLPVDIEGKTILDNALEVFHGCGLKEIVIIKGYKKEKISIPGFRYYEDDYQEGILSSLMYAKQEMCDSFIATYSDILFEPKVVETLLKTEGDIIAVIDTDWRDYYKYRSNHGFDQAEKVMLDGDGVVRIGKTLDETIAHGEFIGMIKCSKKGAKIFNDIYENSKRKYKRLPFHEAPKFEKAYLTDLIQEIIDRGYKIKAAKIQKGWAEFDTPQDYEKLRVYFNAMKGGTKK